MNRGTSGLAGLRGYLAALRRQWWIVLGTTLLAVLVAVAWSSSRQSVYASETTIVVGQGESLLGTQLSIASQPLTQTMTDLLRSDVVARRAIKEVGSEKSADEVLSSLEVSTQPEALALNVTYEDTDRQRSREMLEAIGATFTELVSRRLGDSSEGGSEPVTATVFDPAHVLPGRVSPKVIRTVVLAAFLGLIAGIVLALARDTLSRRIQSYDDAAEVFGVPVTGLLPRGSVATPPLEAHSEGKGFENAFEILGASVRFALSDAESGIVLITSAVPDEGKTALTGHVAAALARGGQEVVAVEADVRAPTLHRLFRVPPRQPGLADVMRGDKELDEALVSVDPTTFRAPASLRMLPAGTQLGDTQDLFTVNKIRELIGGLRALNAYTIVDSAPLLLVPDAYPLVQLVDHVIVVAREGVTRHDDAAAVRDRLSSLGVSDFSIVVTESSEAKRGRYETYGERAVAS